MPAAKKPRTPKVEAPPELEISEVESADTPDEVVLSDEFVGVHKLIHDLDPTYVIGETPLSRYHLVTGPSEVTRVEWAREQ